MSVQKMRQEAQQASDAYHRQPNTQTRFRYESICKTIRRITLRRPN